MADEAVSTSTATPPSGFRTACLRPQRGQVIRFRGYSGGSLILSPQPQVMKAKPCMARMMSPALLAGSAMEA